MTFEHVREPLRRAFAHAVILAAAQKIIAASGVASRLRLRMFRRAAERALAADDLDHR